MDWTHTLTIIGSILIPMLSGFGWIIHRISCIDQRLSRLEGAFDERGKWESRKVSGS
jgi:hypothetical protein